MNSQYKRVSRKRTCLICGKPDWCSYTPDCKISFCARVSEGADRLSRTGWGVFYHESSLFGNFPVPCPAKPPPIKVELAPIEIRDFAYRKLIELSPATEFQVIIDGQQGLRARKILDFHNFGFLPKCRNDRNEIAKIIRCALNREFPEFVKARNFGLSGLPGFWIDKYGNSRLWLDKDYTNPMLLIPYRNERGLIQACQIRFFGNIGNKSFRYVWLSTPEKSQGVSCGSPLHFVSYNLVPNKKPLIITEGALKATTLHFFKPEFDILANAGVTCSHQKIAEFARFRQILIAFDVDYYENFFVALSLAKLFNIIFNDTIKFSSKSHISILTWNPKFRGIDEALINRSTIQTQNIRQWFTSLNSDFQTKILTLLNSPNFLSPIN